MPYHDRKSTRLNSSHGSISYAVFCLKKKKISTASALGAKGLPAGHHGDGDRPRARKDAGLASVMRRTCIHPVTFGLKVLFFLMIRRPPRSTLFPSPTLFR